MHWNRLLSAYTHPWMHFAILFKKCFWSEKKSFETKKEDPSRWLKHLSVGKQCSHEQSLTPRYPITLAVSRSVPSQVSAFISEPPTF